MRKSVRKQLTNFEAEKQRRGQVACAFLISRRFWQVPWVWRNPWRRVSYLVALGLRRWCFPLKSLSVSPVLSQAAFASQLWYWQRRDRWRRGWCVPKNNLHKFLCCPNPFTNTNGFRIQQWYTWTFTAYWTIYNGCLAVMLFRGVTQACRYWLTGASTANCPSLRTAWQRV